MKTKQKQKPVRRRDKRRDKRRGECEWHKEDNGWIAAGCGKDFDFKDLGINRYQFIYCPFCGGEIEV